MLLCVRRLVPRALSPTVIAWHSLIKQPLRQYVRASRRFRNELHDGKPEPTSPPPPPPRMVSSKTVHVRYKSEVVRFLMSATTTLEHILRDSKIYFGIDDPDAGLRDLACMDSPAPPLHYTISQLDPSPQAHFYFQIKSDVDAPEPEPEPEPELEEGTEEESETETEYGTEGDSERPTGRLRNLTANQRGEYFTKHLRARKITSQWDRPKQNIPLSPELEATTKLLESLVRTNLFSKRFKKYMSDLRLPRLSDSGVSGFISSFIDHLAEEQPNLNRDIRIYVRTHQTYLAQEVIKDAPEESAVGRLRHVLKTYLVKGAAIHTFMEEATKRQFTDLRNPWTWYKAAREFKRHVIIHTGPTNSGKTYHALERLISAGSGVYCGPLRLLAHEVYEKLKARGVVCSLITGQQVIEPLFATHVACTVEMADTTEPVDVAVVDEFQMLGDEERGWAWTRAILGIPAKEIHLCGDGSAVKLIARICTDYLGDSVEIKEYQRLSPLIATRGGLKNKNAIQPGDCVVAFSRKHIHAIKQQIERNTGYRCCMVYGNLPPEARSTQAALFNNPNSGYDVLVASDAIGMGLNLNIRRVIFSAMTKFDGTEDRQLTTSEIKQISGRAGRYGSIYPEGHVTCLSPQDTSILINNLQSSIVDLDKAGLSPTFEQLEMFYYADETKPSLAVLLDRFALYASIDNFFFLCDYSNVRELAMLLEPLGMGLKDLYTFCISPADAKKPLAKHSLYQYAATYASDETTVPLRVEPGPEGPIYLGMPHLLETFDDREKLKRLEELYLVLDNYAWLSFRLPKFDEREKAFAMKAQVHEQISSLLDSMSTVGESAWEPVQRVHNDIQLYKDASPRRTPDVTSPSTGKRSMYHQRRRLWEESKAREAEETPPIEAPAPPQIPARVSRIPGPWQSTPEAGPWQSTPEVSRIPGPWQSTPEEHTTQRVVKSTLFKSGEEVEREVLQTTTEQWRRNGNAKLVETQQMTVERTRQFPARMNNNEPQSTNAQFWRPPTAMAHNRPHATEYAPYENAQRTSDAEHEDGEKLRRPRRRFANRDLDDENESRNAFSISKPRR